MLSIQAYDFSLSLWKIDWSVCSHRENYCYFFQFSCYGSKWNGGKIQRKSKVARDIDKLDLPTYCCTFVEFICHGRKWRQNSKKSKVEFQQDSNFNKQSNLNKVRSGWKMKGKIITIMIVYSGVHRLLFFLTEANSNIHHIYSFSYYIIIIYWLNRRKYNLKTKIKMTWIFQHHVNYAAFYSVSPGGGYFLLNLRGRTSKKEKRFWQVVSTSMQWSSCHLSLFEGNWNNPTNIHISFQKSNK